MTRGLTNEKYECGPNCEGCPFRDVSQGYVGSRGNDNGQYLILGGAPKYKAIETGRTFEGGPGSIVNGLLHRNTNIRPSTDCKFSYGVRCMPIAWNVCPSCHGSGCDVWTQVESYEFQCQDGKVPKISQYTHDFVDAIPTPAQVSECARRYLQQELQEFHGNTVVMLGSTAIRALAGKAGKAEQLNGSVYEYGEATPCEACASTGLIEIRREVKCKKCPKKIYLDKGIRCPSHPTYKGKGKPRRHGCLCIQMFYDSWRLPGCVTCRGTGKIVKVRGGKCSPCKGKGSTWAKTDAKLSRLLKPGQLAVATMDPLELMKRKTMFPAVDAVFKRLEKIHDTDAILEGDYTYFPDSDKQATYSWSDEVSIDIETPFGADPRCDKILLASVSDAPETSVVFKPDDPRFLEALDAERIIGQNYTIFDAWWLYIHTGKRPKSIFDTRFAGHLLNPDTPNNLTVLSCEYAVPPMEGYWKSSNNYKDRLETVCALDTDATYRVQRGQLAALNRDGLHNVMEKQVVPLSSVCLDMRIAGMKLDEEAMNAKRIQYLDTISKERAKLPYGGTELSKGLKTWLYSTCNLPSLNNREGRNNTRKETLAKLEEGLRLGTVGGDGDRHEMADQIRRVLNLRTMSKLVGTFLSYEFEGEPFIHPILNPAGTATFRLSCSGPNTQQVPKGARSIFIPDEPGRMLTSIDISQAEVVSFLWMAEEWEIYNQVLNGADVHSLMATLCGISRTEAKVTTFALLYGEMPETTAVRLGISLENVLSIRRAYFAALPGVERYRNAVLNFCRDSGYVLSPFNTRRYLQLKDRETLGRTVNQAMNTPIQNIPAMITRIGMVNAAATLPADARLWMQVHDEILVEHDVADSNSVVSVLRAALTDAMQSPLLIGNPYGRGKSQPLKFNMDVEQGKSWGTLELVA